MLKVISLMGVLVAILPTHLVWIAAIVLVILLYPPWRASLAKSNADAAEHKLRKSVADLRRRLIAAVDRGADKRP